MQLRYLPLLLLLWVGLSSAQAVSADSVLDQKWKRVVTQVDQEKAAAADPALEMRSLTGVLVQTFFALALVVALIVLLVYLLKRLSHGRGTFGGSAGKIEVLDSAMIAPNQWVVIVRVYEQNLILGVSSENISYLSDLTTASEAAMVDGPTTPGQFSQTVDQMLARFKRPSDSGNLESSSGEGSA